MKAHTPSFTTTGLLAVAAVSGGVGKFAGLTSGREPVRASS